MKVKGGPKSNPFNQYFTENESLQNLVFDLVKNKSGRLLEPSVGRGHLLRPFLPRENIVAVEIDKTLTSIPSVIYGDFLAQTNLGLFDVIIANPPFDRNCFFVRKCFEMLEPDGELVLILPSDFLKLRMSFQILKDMSSVGAFTDFHFSDKTKMFKSAQCINVVTFRYKKGEVQGKCRVKREHSDGDRYIHFDGSLFFTDTETLAGTLFSEMFDIFGGMTSGCDTVFKNETFGNVNVLIDQNKVQRMILLDNLPLDDKPLMQYLERERPTLDARTVKQKDWWKWASNSNISKMKQHAGKPCIYVKCVSRNTDVAFAGTVQLIGPWLWCLLPKNPNQDLEPVLRHLNSDAIKREFGHARQVKIGKRHLETMRS